MSKEKETKTTENNTGGEKYDLQKDIQENKAITFLSYLGILALVPLLAKKESKFAQFHSKQGLVLAIVFFIASWVSGVIPVIGWLILYPVVLIAGLVFTIMGFVYVAKGEMTKLPIIGDLVEKINL